MARKGSRRTPEMVMRLVDMGTKRLIEQLHVPEEQARLAMRGIAHELCLEFGGGPIYVPKNREFELTERDEAIWAAYDGSNLTALAQTYNLTERQLHDIIGHVKSQKSRERQRVLPGLEEQPA